MTRTPGAMLLCLLALVTGCESSKPIIKTVAVDVVRYERVPVPDELLVARCGDVALAEVQTNRQLEEAAARLYSCNKEHNADKAKIKELK